MAGNVVVFGGKRKKGRHCGGGQSDLDLVLSDLRILEAAACRILDRRGDRKTAEVDGIFRYLLYLFVFGILEVIDEFPQWCAGEKDLVGKRSF